MEIEDLSGNKRVAGLWNLSRELQKTTSPGETMRAIRVALAQAYGPIVSVMLATRGLALGEYQIVQINLDPNAIPDLQLSADATVYRGGIMGRIVSVVQPRLIQRVDWKSDPVFGKSLDGCESVVAIPMVSEQLAITWILLFKRAPDFWDSSGMEEAIVRSTLVACLLESKALVGDLAKANSRIDREMRQTGELQRMLLPDPLPRIPGLEMAVSYEPSGRAGGDLFDVFLLKDTNDERPRWCVLMADASGHGLVAAVVMAIVQSILRAHPSVISGPADLLTHINTHLCQKNIGGFVTAFLGIYTPGTRRLTYSLAGHPAPVKKSTTGVAGMSGALSLPLGIESTTTFEEACTYLIEGDTLLLYTDGITDARNPQGELFDTPRLEAELNRADALPHQIITHLRDKVNEHQNGGSASDDQTMLVIRMIG